jgi:dipeptidase D
MNIPNEDLKGTADGYSADVNNTGKLFLVYFPRDCSDLEEITDDHCVEIPTTLIPEGDKIVLAVRDYIKPDTQRGPDSSLVLPSRVLTLQNGDMTTAILSIFEDISQIPRCSKNEAAISDWLVDWADQRGLQVTTDAFKNVLITVPASAGFENQAPIVLQSHMDMVCQKEPDSSHDFMKDPIVLVRDGDWLSAEDTTLGADDGIGIAIALTIADSPSIKHPKLEVLVTTDEEVDMTGAAGLSDTLLTGEKYVNLDSETEGVITIGAAGGIKIDLSLPLAFSTPLPFDQIVFSLEIAGLLGGHSGVDINKGRANANYLAAQALAALAGVVPLRLIDFVGGSADNVITQSSEIRFAVSSADVGLLQTSIAQFEQNARDQYPAETGMTVTLTELSNTAQPAVSEADSVNAVSLIASLPQGVYEWSTDLPGQAETSDNIGIVKTQSDALDATTFARSFDPEKLESIASLIETTAATYGASTIRRSAFPAWPPNTDSALYNTFLSSYQDLFGVSITSEIVHAGLECGYIAEKYPGMQIVSIGPTLQDVHSTRERLYVPSLEKIVGLLAEVLRRP